MQTCISYRVLLRLCNAEVNAKSNIAAQSQWCTNKELLTTQEHALSGPPVSLGVLTRSFQMNGDLWSWSIKMFILWGKCSFFSHKWKHYKYLEDGWPSNSGSQRINSKYFNNTLTFITLCLVIFHLWYGKCLDYYGLCSHGDFQSRFTIFKLVVLRC